MCRGYCRSRGQRQVGVSDARKQKWNDFFCSLFDSPHACWSVKLPQKSCSDCSVNTRAVLSQMLPFWECQMQSNTGKTFWFAVVMALWIIIKKNYFGHTNVLWLLNRKLTKIKSRISSRMEGSMDINSIPEKYKPTSVTLHNSPVPNICSVDFDCLTTAHPLWSMPSMEVLIGLYYL